MSKKWIFVIDTDSYAGNFERELCAYVTGVIGECEVGEEYMELFLKEERGFTDKFGDSLFNTWCEQRPDDRGCSRPGTVWKTPGRFENARGGRFREDDEYADEKAKAHYQAHVSKELWDEIKDKPLQRYSAYLSVAIFFEGEIGEKKLELLKRRALLFPQKTKNIIGKPWTFKITGFRILEEEMTTREIMKYEV